MSQEWTNILTLDLETTIHTYNKRKASPFYPKNRVVAAGYAHNNDPVFCNYFADELGWKYHEIPIRKETNVLVGFNIKFDLLYMWDKRVLREYLKRGGRIWDAQYVHYLLHGMQQSVHMVSMDSVVEEYGGKLKIDAVKDYWEDGVDTPDIPEDLLMNYLAGDIDNTRQIYVEQRKLCEEIHPNFLQMVWNRMDGLLSTIEMEYNGLQVDTDVGEQDRTELYLRQQRGLAQLDTGLPKLPTNFRFNWGSGHHRSALLFGGALKYKEWEPHRDAGGSQLYATKTEKEMVVDSDGNPVRYISGKKKGEIKYRNVKVPDLTKPKGKIQEKTFSLPGITKGRNEWIGLQRDPAGVPIYSTNSEIIEILGNTTDIPFLKLFAETQKISKDLKTYYWDEDKNGNKKGMLTLVGSDGRIHHKLNHTSTVTGRLSSSDPNMQNIPRGDKSLAKRMFVSRFGNAGKIIEIDYSQLEVIVQGVLSRDKQLCADIREGVDFHVKRLAASTGESYESLKAKHLAGDADVCAARTLAKGFSFQRAYGAGPQAIADSTGMSVSEVKDLIEAEERLYPDVLAFDRSVEKTISESRKPLDKWMAVDGVSVKPCMGEWFCPTGTRYVWTEKEAPSFLKEQQIRLSFSPTERKNYPVQGLGGEIVQTVTGKLFRHFLSHDNYWNKALLVNTVHDCVLIDAHIDVMDSVIRDAVHIMTRVPNIFNYYFDMGIDVPFPVEVEVGKNWYDMEHYEI